MEVVYETEENYIEIANAKCNFDVTSRKQNI